MKDISPPTEAGQAGSQAVNKRALLWLRQSSQGQLDNTSRLTQFRETLKRAEAVGAKVVRIVGRTRSQSGTVDTIEERLDMQEVLEAVQTQGINLVIVREWKRVGREVAVTLQFVKRLERLGVTLMDATGRIAHSDDMAFIVEAGIGATDASDLWSKLSAGQFRRAEKGLLPNGKVPWPLRTSRDPRTGKSVGLEFIDDDAKAAARRAIELLLQGRTMREAAHFLNGEGWKYNGHRWTYGALQTVLKHDVLAGQIQRTVSTYDRERRAWMPHEVLILCPAVCSPEELAKVRRLVNARHRKGHASKVSAALSGLVWCMEHQRPVPMYLTKSGRPGSTARYFRCSTKSSAAKAGEAYKDLSPCVRGLLRCDKLDGLVWEALTVDTLGGSVLEAPLWESARHAATLPEKAKDRQKEIEGEIRKVERARDQFLDDVTKARLENRDSLPYLERARELDFRVETLREEVTRLERHARSSVATARDFEELEARIRKEGCRLVERWARAGQAERQGIIRLLLPDIPGFGVLSWANGRLDVRSLLSPDGMAAVWSPPAEKGDWMDADMVPGKPDPEMLRRWQSLIDVLSTVCVADRRSVG